MKPSIGGNAIAFEPQHAQSLIKGLKQASLGQIVGANKSIAIAMVFAAEHANTSSGHKSRRNAGDTLLLGHHSETVTALKKHLYKVRTSCATC